MIEGGKADANRPAAFAILAALPPALTAFVVLTLAGLVYLGITSFSTEQTLGWVASAALVAAISRLHLRHSLMAVAVAAVPLAGVIWSGVLTHLMGATRVVPVGAYALGVVLAVHLSDRFVAGVLGDRPAAEAASRAQGDILRPALAALVVAAVLVLLTLFAEGVTLRMAALEAVFGWVLAALPVALALPAVFARLTFNEAFIARANRARERRVTRAYRLSMVSVPRWGMSVSGVALVMAMLSWFGASPLPLPAETGGLAIPLGIAAVVAFAVAYMVVDNWRDALALSLATLTAGLLDLWAGVLLDGTGARAAVAVVDGLLLALVSMFVVASRVRQLRENGDDEAIARLRAIENLAGPCVFAALAAAAALLVWSIFPVAVAAGVGAVAALLFAPALATAINTLLPKRRSVEELYTRR
jgi:hypothetical protein